MLSTDEMKYTFIHRKDKDLTIYRGHQLNNYLQSQDEKLPLSWLKGHLKVA